MESSQKLVENLNMLSRILKLLIVYANEKLETGLRQVNASEILR